MMARPALNTRIVPEEDTTIAIARDTRVMLAAASRECAEWSTGRS
jgi:hypothetical protein